MAYISGIFHIDLVNGSDAARTALTSCTASNPSGSITRINKTAHGLVTGAVVDLTLFSASLNGAFKITVVDANNFDLDATPWPSPADTSGTVTPRGGMNWADAWLTIGSGATAARIQPGDEFRIAKTADPVSLGQNATWTDGSQTVTLTTAVTKKIEDAISGWTASANVTASANTIRKMGATAQELAVAAPFTTGKIAYKAIAGGGTQDFSAYQYINLWLFGNGNSFAANIFKICLCSDATGDVIVNEINIPAVSNTVWTPVSLNYGAALGSNIQSVAIYMIVDQGATNIRVNNIFAGNNDLTLKNLIGKSGDVNYNVQSVDGTTIKIDSFNSAASGRGYSGTTVTVTLYYRVPLDVSVSGTWATMSEAGDTLTAYNDYSGGWNTGSNTRDGHTCLGNILVGQGVALSFLSYSKLSYFVLARFGSNTLAASIEMSNVVFCGGNFIGANTNMIYAFWDTCKILNCPSVGQIAGGVMILKSCEFRNNGSTGFQGSSGNNFISCVFANNGSGSLQADNLHERGTGACLLRNCTLLDSTEVTFTATRFGAVWSFDHDDTIDNHWGFFNGATINWQTSTKHGSDPGAWKVIISSNTRTSFKPVPVKIAEVDCAANALVTVKAWVLKDHATNVAAKIYVEDGAYNIDGVSATSATKANDTSWEQLTITFTPTQKGIVPIFMDSWYVAGASNCYVGSVEITQA